MARRKNTTKGNRRREPRRSAGELVRDAAGSARTGAPRVLTVVCAAGIALGVPFASLKAYTYVVSSERFAVRTIDIQGARRADKTSLLERAQIAPGINVFDVDEQAAGLAIQADPWISDATVVRALPNTISIRVTERAPAALVLDAPNFVLTERDGSPIKILAPEDVMEAANMSALPLVTGLSAEALGQGGERGARAREKFEAALEAQRALEALGIEGLGVAEAHVDEVMGVTLVLDPHGEELRLGWGRVAERLQRFKIVYESLASRGVAIEYVLIDHEDDLDRVAVGPRKPKDGGSRTE